MSNEPNSKDSSMAKTIASNLCRAGMLAITGVGAAIERAIFGSLNDKAREEARRQIHNDLDELSMKSGQALIWDILMCLLGRRIFHWKHPKSKGVRDYKGGICQLLRFAPIYMN